MHIARTILISLVCVLFLSGEVFAQDGNNEVYLPIVQSGEGEVSAAQEEEPPIGFTICKAVGGWVGELWCHFVYIVIVDSGPEGTPTPPPTPEPTPIPTFWLSAPASEILRTNRECKFDFRQLTRVCLVEGQFIDVVPDFCPTLVGVGILFNDEFNPSMQARPQEILMFDEEGIRLEFYPPAVDTGPNNAYNPQYFTAWLQCSE